MTTLENFVYHKAKNPKVLIEEVEFTYCQKSPSGSRWFASRQDVADQIAMHVGQAEIAALKFEG